MELNNELMEICLNFILDNEKMKYKLLNELATIDDVAKISQKY